MKALITGAGGQVGRALLATCPEGVMAVGVTRTELDLTDASAIKAAVAKHHPDVIFNAAAYTAVDKAESEPELAHQINGEAVGLLAKTGIKLVHVSTDFVFDGKQSTPYQPGDVPNPQSIYGASKLAGEQAAGPDALIVRTAWVYAAAGANFVNTMLRLMAEKSALSVVADQIGTPTYATSLAETLWALQAQGATGIYHYTDSGVASWYDFAVAIQEEARVLGLLEKAVLITPIPASAYPTPATRPAFSVLDKSTIWDALGGPGPHWRDNLRKMLKQVEAHG